MRNFLIALVVAAITAWSIGFTTPGHRLLSAIGFTTAAIVPVAKEGPGVQARTGADAPPRR
jgi:hypothetical protein